jgi:hypothetical protein
MLLNDVLWTRPIMIRLQCGLERTFTGIHDALDFLENEWPLRRGQRYERAVKTCREALDGIIAPVIAREAFTAASLEAGMATTVAGQKPEQHPLHSDADLPSRRATGGWTSSGRPLFQPT